jgi:DNA-binding phage protein
MGKKGTLKNQRQSLPASLKRHKFSARPFGNTTLIKEIIIEAMTNNDLDTVEDVLIAYLKASSKSKLARLTGLGRQTLYDLIDRKKEFNPTLKTFGTILQAIPA